jgi:hypothetical protein
MRSVAEDETRYEIPLKVVACLTQAGKRFSGDDARARKK